MPHLPYVASFPVDFIALQEVRLTIDGQKIIDEALNPYGWKAVWGKAQPIRKGTTKSITDAKQGGVGIMVRKQHQATSSPRTEIGDRLFETGRWQSCAIKINRGGCLVHVVSVYGFPGANEGGEEMEQNEALIQDVFLEAASLGDVPVVIGGDFNAKLENSPFLSEMMSSGAWNDAASLFATAAETIAEDTYQTAIGSSRIDMLFMNAAATRIFKNCSVVAVPPEGIKRHKPVEAHWSFNLSREFADRVRPVRGLPKKRTNASAQELELLLHEVVSLHIDEFYTAYF